MDYMEGVAPLKTGKSTQVAIRIEDELLARLEALVTKLSPPGMALPRSEVIRAALAKGLEALEGGGAPAASVNTTGLVFTPTAANEVELGVLRECDEIEGRTNLHARFVEAVDRWIGNEANSAIKARRVPKDKRDEWAKRLEAVGSK